MTADLYAILGIDSSASLDEVKRAYFRKVREHSPEKDPENFKLIRSAYETLSDETARRDYDGLRMFGGEIQALSEEAEERAAAEDWDAAIRLYKRILVLHPDFSAARNRLGMCYMQADRYVEAIQVLEQVVKDNPLRDAYWMNLGWAYMGQAGGAAPSQLDALKRAQECFYEVAKRNPTNSEAYQAVAATYREVEDYTNAADWLEKAVAADGKTDLHDFDTLMQLATVYIISEQNQKLDDTLRRLVSVAPDDQDSRRYMAARLSVLGGQLAEANRFSEASKVFLHGCELNPADDDARDAAAGCAQVADAMSEFDRLSKDSSILDAVKALVALRLQSAIGDTQPSDYEINRVLTAINTWPRSEVKSSVKHLRSKYPACYALAGNAIDALESGNFGVSQMEQTGREATGCLAGLLGRFAIWGAIGLVVVACGAISDCSSGDVSSSTSSSSAEDSEYRSQLEPAMTRGNAALGVIDRNLDLNNAGSDMSTGELYSAATDLESVVTLLHAITPPTEAVETHRLLTEAYDFYGQAARGMADGSSSDTVNSLLSRAGETWDQAKAAAEEASY